MGALPSGLIVVEAAPGRPFSSLDLEVLEGVADLFSLAFQRLDSRKSDWRRASIEADRRVRGERAAEPHEGQPASRLRG